MIVGIGLDVVDTAKLRELLSEGGGAGGGAPGFEERIFTPAERRDCAERVDKADALAARFAAKEACFKALGTGWSGGVSFLQVEVRKTDGGAPTLELSGE